ncbi:MAG: hypothetical protein H7832_12065 [Magnetococcus sp. DMHC-6]
MAWMATLFLWLRKKPAPKNSSPPTHKPRSNPRALEVACVTNQPQQAKEALLDWAKTHWTHQTPTTLGALGKRLDDIHIQSALAELDQALYGEPQDWQGASLWQLIAPLVKNQKKQIKTNDKSNLEPLNP